MALTLNWGPTTEGGGDISDPQPVYGPQNTAIYWIWGSTNAAKENFKFNFLVSVGGLTYTYKVPPTPATGKGQIALSDILKSYISYDLQPTAAIAPWTLASNSYCTYSICAVEEYNPGKTFSDTQYVGAGSLGFTFSTPHGFGAGDLITVLMNDPFLNPQYNGTASVTSVPNPYLIVVDKTFDAVTSNEGGTITNVISYSTKDCADYVNVAWNGSRQYTDRSEYYNTFQKYWKDNRFLSNYKNYNYSVGVVATQSAETLSYPSMKPVFCLDDYGTGATAANYYGPDQYESLSWITNKNEGPGSILNGLEVRVLDKNGVGTTYALSATGSYPAYSCMYIAGAGPAQINKAYGSPIINSNTKNYYVRYKDGYEWRAYTIVCNCSPYENYRIYFLNNLGAFDFWNFNYISKDTYNINRTTFDKTLPWNYKVEQRGTTILSQEVSESIYLSSDWIDEEQSKYLKELIYSPEVYIFKKKTGVWPDTDAWEIGEFELIPLVIDTNSYEIRTNLKDKLFCISFDATMAYGISTQNQ